ncbi:MAG: hypothetical protein H7Y08_00455 [Rhizobiaceae bacterium]|nr:hypothetical protein [Rhizobiaceae bacterium]
MGDHPGGSELDDGNGPLAVIGRLDRAQGKAVEIHAGEDRTRNLAVDLR